MKDSGHRLAVRAADYAWIVAAQARASRAQLPGDWSAGDRVPVVLLPGVYETWGVLADVGHALHAAGHPVHVVPALGRNAASLADGARLVATRLHRLQLDRAVLVAHSKGGLIGKLVLGDPSLADALPGMVTVNTPFGGSALARWFPTRAVRSLAPDHPQVQAVAASTVVHARIASLSAPFDPHVPEGSVLPGARNVALPLDGHFRPLGDARVHAAVVEAVRWVDDAPTR